MRYFPAVGLLSHCPLHRSTQVGGKGLINQSTVSGCKRDPVYKGLNPGQKGKLVQHIRTA